MKWGDVSPNEEIGSAPVRLELAGVGVPTVDDDEDLGFGPGSLWVDSVFGSIYDCLDGARGAARWAAGWHDGGDSGLPFGTLGTADDAPFSLLRNGIERVTLDGDYVGIGAASVRSAAQFELDVGGRVAARSQDGDPEDATVVVESASAVDVPVVGLLRSRGLFGAETDVLVGDDLGAIVATGWVGGSYRLAAGLGFSAPSVVGADLTGQARFLIHDAVVGDVYPIDIRYDRVTIGDAANPVSLQALNTVGALIFDTDAVETQLRISPAIDVGKPTLCCLTDVDTGIDLAGSDVGRLVAGGDEIARWTPNYLQVGSELRVADFDGAAASVRLDSDVEAIVRVFTAIDTAGIGSNLVFRRTRGVIGTETAVSDEDLISVVTHQGTDSGGGVVPGAREFYYVDSAPTASGCPLRKEYWFSDGSTGDASVKMLELSSVGFGLFGVAATAQSTGWSVSNHTDDRALDETGDTLLQTKNVLGSLLTELLTKGVIGA